MCALYGYAQERDPQVKPQIITRLFKKVWSILADLMGLWALECHENPPKKVNHRPLDPMFF